MRTRDVRGNLAATAKQQNRVLSRSQLREAGLGKDHVRNQLQAGRWTSVGRHAVLLANSEPTDLQRAWIAVLNCNHAAAALTGLTAATYFGLRGYETRTQHVAVPWELRVRNPGPDTLVHRSRSLTPAHLHPRKLPPTVRLERALIDAAAWSARPDDACGLLAAAVQQRLTTADRLSAELAARTRVRGREWLHLTLRDIAGGAQSLAELRFGVLCQRAGLPAPLRQTVRKDPFGRLRYLDIEYPCQVGGTFGIEIDGSLHLMPDTYWDDMSRDNELVLSGLAMLRFPALALRLHPDKVTDQVRRMFQSGGFRP